MTYLIALALGAIVSVFGVEYGITRSEQVREEYLESKLRIKPGPFTSNELEGSRYRQSTAREIQ